MDFFAKLKNLKDLLQCRIPSNLSVPHIIQYFYVSLAGLATLIGFFMLLVTLGGGTDWQVALGVVAAWTVILGAVMAVKKLLEYLYTSHRTGAAAQAKNSLLIGFAGSMVFGFLPRIYSLCDPLNSELNYFFLFVSLFAISLIHKVFIAESKKDYRITYDTTDVLPWLILTGNYVLFCISTKLSDNRGYYYGFYGNDGVFWVQVLMAPICAVAMIEFGQVLMDKVVSVQLKKEPKREKKNPSAFYEDPLMRLNDEKPAALVHQSSVVLTEEQEPQL